MIAYVVLSVLLLGSAASQSDPWMWGATSVFVFMATMWSFTTIRAVRIHGWEPLAPGDRLGAPSRGRHAEAD